MGVVVEFKVVNADHGVVVLKWLRTAKDGADAGHHFVQAEGFGDVVVATDCEAGDFVLGIVLRREE
ncbi:hypothetical protein D3C87_2118270 [compost metagenome]